MFPLKDDLVGEIKRRLSITDLARREGLPLRKAGRNKWKTHCIFPGHVEKKPSLYFYEETGTYRCYGCGVWGDVINLWGELKGIEDNTEAILSLAKYLGISKKADRRGGEASIGSILKAYPKPHKARKAETMPEELSLIMELFRDHCNGLDEESRAYLKGNTRGLTDETIEKFGLFSIKDYQEAKKFLISTFPLERLKELSLIIESRKGRKFFPLDRYKIVMPVVQNGRVVALRGRYFYKGSSNPEESRARETRGKYSSTRYIVSGMLFNGDILKALTPGERVFLCESEFDTMIAEQNGKNAVGLLGASSYTAETIKRLNPFDLVLAFDNDENGRGKEQAKRICGIFHEQTGRQAWIDTSLKTEGVKDVTELFLKRNGL